MEQDAVEDFPFLFGDSLAALGDNVRDPLVYFDGVFFSGVCQYGPGTVFFAVAFVGIAYETIPGHIGEYPGNTGFIFFTQPAEIGSCEAAGSLVQVIEAHDIGAFQTERLHMVFFDFLNTFVNLRDGSRKIFKPFSHDCPRMVRLFGTG